MLKPTRITDTRSAQRLIRLWTARYLPDLSILPTQKGQFPVAEIVETASAERRTQTADKVRRSLRTSCEMAGVRVNTLFAYVPNIVNLDDARRIATGVEQVYSQVLALYEQQEPPSLYLRYGNFSSQLFAKLAGQSLTLPVLNTLAETLDPVLLRLQEQHLTSSDPRTVGFLTTQFHFSTRQILDKLSICERILFSPYLKFVEEQVCIPWQRICAAAARHPQTSSMLAIVEQLLPLSQDIAQAVYQQTMQRYSTHRSRRGELGDPEVMASTLRDLNMFQGYLWLCVLEGSLASIEQELLPLCHAVFPAIGVKWELVEYMLQRLESELLARLAPDQQLKLQRHTQALRAQFANSPTVPAIGRSIGLTAALAS